MRPSPPPLAGGGRGEGAPTTPGTTPAERALQSAAAATTLEDLRAAIAAFDGCALRDTASNLMFAEGDPSATLLLIGDPPGADEDRSGTAFAGPAGDYLDRMLAAISLERGQLLHDPADPVAPARRPAAQPGGDRRRACPSCTASSRSAAPRRLLLMGLLAARALLPQAASRRRPRGEWMDAAIPGTLAGAAGAAHLQRGRTDARPQQPARRLGRSAPAAPHAGCRRRGCLDCAHQEGRAMPLDESRPFIAVNIAVLTVSDTRTLADDRSGDALAERIAKAGHRVAARAIEKDDAGAIERHLRAWIADPRSTW